MTRSNIGILSDAQHWRDRAEEARALAEQMISPDAKQLMLNNAKGYEAMANRADQQKRSLLR